MPTSSPQTIKLRSLLRLLIPRLRTLQQKDTSLSIASRREMATLLGQSRVASARIRVESIIHTDICVELMEILELYAELLLARASMLDQKDRNSKEYGEGATIMDPGVEEAAAAVIYAAPRLPREVRELGQVRVLLVERFGKDFGIKAQDNQDNVVPERVVKKVKALGSVPEEFLVQNYLEAIAETYGVDWPKDKNKAEMEQLREEVDEEDRGADGDDDGVGGGANEAPLLAEQSTVTTTPAPKRQKVDIGPAFDPAELSRATPPKAIAPGGAKSPVSVAPPGARTDNLSPKVKLPGGQEAKPKESTSTGGGTVPGKVPTVDDLARRFKDLKR